MPGEGKPILLMYPGLSGGACNWYTMGLIFIAEKNGYVCGTLLFRGSENLPLTSPMYCISTSWGDGIELSTHVHKKYCLDSSGAKTRNLYGYGCSLGAVLLMRQLEEEGSNTKFDGSVQYATPWATYDGWQFFFCHNFGIYSWVIGMNLSAIW